MQRLYSGHAIRVSTHTSSNEVDTNVGPKRKLPKHKEIVKFIIHLQTYLVELAIEMPQ